MCSSLSGAMRALQPVVAPPPPCNDSMAPRPGHKYCLLQHAADRTWYRRGSTDYVNHAENRREYPALLEALSSRGRPPRLVVDAGANDGFSTWLFATRWPHATVREQTPGRPRVPPRPHRASPWLLLAAVPGAVVEPCRLVYYLWLHADGPAPLGPTAQVLGLESSLANYAVRAAEHGRPAVCSHADQG